MKRFATFAAGLLLAIATTAGLRAQVPPPPTPSPDPHTYNDPAMSFTAPSSALLIARRSPALSDLGEDLEVVAAWVLRPNTEDARTITIAMEAYTGPPDQWESQFESQTHGSGDGTLIRDKTAMSLLNGMPAYFVEVAFGSGFDSRKEYAIVWADGQRGVVLAETSAVGEVGADEAKRMLHDVSAVRYPVSQP